LLATAQVTGLEGERDSSKALAAHLETRARDEEAGKDAALERAALLAGQLEELRREVFRVWGVGCRVWGVGCRV